MARKIPPPQLSEIGLEHSTFVYSDKKSWRGACPACGGHRRFVIFTEKEYPLWNGFCSLCGFEIKAWEKVRRQIDPIKLAAYRAKADAEAKRERENRRLKLAEFSNSELWEELNERMAEEQRAWWDSQGIPDGVQDYLRLGYTEKRGYADDFGELRYSPAYTIPWFGQNFQLKTMQYRLTDPINLKDKYRFQKDLGGGGAHYYMADPSEPIGDKVIICEGAKKAIVTWFWLRPKDFTVIAASSNNTIRTALEATKESGLRYVILDPKSEHWERVARSSNPKTTKIISLPYKVDDGFVDYGLKKPDFEKILTNAL